MKKPNYMLLLGFGVLFILGYYLKTVLTPFYISVLLSYILTPIARKLEDFQLPGGLAAAVTLILVFCLVIFIAFSISPLIIKQFGSLVLNLPNYLQIALAKIKNNNYLHSSLSYLVDNFESMHQNLDEWLPSISMITVNSIDYLRNYISTYVVSLINIFLVPIISFYFIRDRQLLLTYLIENVHKAYKHYVQNFLAEADRVFAVYLRAQLLLCIIMATVYAISLTIIGLNYSIVLGLLVGLLSIVPYMGITIGGFITLMVTYSQFNELIYVAFVGMVFIFINLIESNILVPRLVGKTMGLHPLIVMLVILIGGKFAGIVGIFLAIPLATLCLNFTKYCYRYHK